MDPVAHAASDALRHQEEPATAAAPLRPPCELGVRVHEQDSEGMARLAQSVERKALNLVVVGSSPAVGVLSSDLDASNGG